MPIAFITWTTIVICAGLFVLCDGLSAHWGKTGSRSSMTWILLLAPASYAAFALLNKRMDLAVAGAFVNTLVVVGTTFVGLIVFREQVSTQQIVGLGMAIAALTLLNLA